MEGFTLDARRFRRRCLSTVALLLSVGLSHGAEDGSPHQPFNSNQRPAIDQGRVTAPPLSGNLLEVALNIPTYPYRVSIDPDSVKVTGDGEVRYVVILRTPGGSENRFYEGIHCLQRDFRVYANAGPDGQWVDSRNESWQPLRNHGSNRYRYQFYQSTMCDGAAGPHSRSVILGNIRYNRNFNVDE